MLNKLVKLISRRQLHTIVSRDIIKPSSPTPSHHKTYNLSLLDQIAINAFIPFVMFYESSSAYHSSFHDKTLILKKSLSQTLTEYYPFAGRLKKFGPTYVDCNDEGVEFIEARNTKSLSSFLGQTHHQDLDQLFPNDQIWFNPNQKGQNDENSITCPLAVQVNHFSCGGIALAVSLSHKIADGSSFFNFFNHWGTITARCNSEDASLPINPHFIRYKTRNSNLSKFVVDRSPGDCVTKTFLFSNQKINNLKDKVLAMTIESGQPITNPTRTEVLTWLLHNCFLEAAKKNNSGTSIKSGMLIPINLRKNLVDETSIGNLCVRIAVPTRNQKELAPNTCVGELRRKKAEVRNKTSLETAFRLVVSDDMSCETLLEICKRNDGYYIYSSLCGLPMFENNFGWGKPFKVTLGGGMRNVIFLMDTLNGDGIEALVCLEKQDMKIFQSDPRLLNLC